MLVGALPMDDVLVDFLSRNADAHEALTRFAGAQGEALSVEGWIVAGMLTHA